MTYARDERAALCDLFEQTGPDAPTLCEGWTTFDLLAHLVLRERRPDAAAGAAIKALAGRAASKQESLKEEHGYSGLVTMFRTGPGGVYNAIPRLDETVNTVEFFIHHEDVRRAQAGWEPRTLPTELEDVLWKRLRTGVRVLLRKAPVAVVLNRVGGGVALGGATDRVKVELTGPASELLMFCSGRQTHAKVDLAGDDAAAADLLNARLGV